MLNKYCKLLCIFICSIIIGTPNTTHAEVEKGYDYANINACYLMGNNKAVKTEKQAGYDVCLGSTTQAVDYTKLSCPEGYSLYNLKVSQGGTSKSGYGCRKEYTKEYTLKQTYYCGYWGYGYYYLLVSTNDTTELFRQISGLGADEFPAWNDPNWQPAQETYTVEVKNKCPNYMIDNDNLRFADTYGKYEMDYPLRTTHVEEEKIYIGSPDSPGSESDPTPAPNPNYTQIFKSGDACTLVKDIKWENVCHYSSGDGIDYLVYVKKDRMFVAAKGWDWYRETIETKFSFNQYYEKNGVNCPTTLYYWRDVDLTYLALEDTDNQLYIRYKLTRVKNHAEFQLPDHCYELGELGLSSNDCEGILGRPEEEGSVAYYLQMVFNIMKYVAIILLIGLTIMDFVGAITSHDDDQLKKATSKAVTRLIICVILFVLPTIIEFLMKVLDVYGDAGGCKIR